MSMQEIFDLLKNPNTKSNLVRAIDTLTEYDDQEVRFAEDPIALACANYRETSSGRFHGFGDLNSVTVNEKDREEAARVRRYYSDRFAMSVLRGYTLSEYRKKLYAVMNDNAPLKRKDLGLLYKLPYFYQEDMVLEQLALENFNSDRNIDQTLVARLTPKTSYRSRRKNFEGVIYWWTTDENHLVQWPVSEKNPLGSLVDGLFSSGRPSLIQANFMVGERSMARPLKFYRISQPRLIFDENKVS